MSNALIKALRDVALEPSHLKFVLFCYADHASDHDGLAWPSIATVARVCALAEGTVRADVGRLCAAGWLVPRAFQTGGRGRSTVYRVMPSVSLPGDEQYPLVPQEGIASDNTLPSHGRVSTIPSRATSQNPPVPRDPKHQEAMKHQRARAREAERPAAAGTSRGAGPTPVTTQLVIDAIATTDPGLADVLRRNTPPAGAAPESSEPTLASPKETHGAANDEATD